MTTTPTGTRAALDAALIEWGTAVARGSGSAEARTALDRAITAHVEAEVARRLAAAPDVEVAIGSVTCRRCDHDDPLGDSVSDALRAAIAADKARAVEAADDAAFIRGRDAVRKYPEGWGLVARPTPDEARSIGRVAEHLRGLAAEVEPSRMADGFEADRMRLLAHRLRQVAALMPDSDEARRLVEEFERACDAWQYREAEARTAARTALLAALTGKDHT